MNWTSERKRETVKNTGAEIQDNQPGRRTQIVQHDFGHAAVCPAVYNAALFFDTNRRLVSVTEWRTHRSRDSYDDIYAADVIMQQPKHKQNETTDVTHSHTPPLLAWPDSSYCTLAYKKYNNIHLSYDTDNQFSDIARQMSHLQSYKMSRFSVKCHDVTSTQTDMTSSRDVK